MLTQALSYLHADISVIPVAPDGTKRPLIAWKQFQQARPDEATVRKWSDTVGIAIVCGEVSGLEVIDFDHLPSYEAWTRIVDSEVLSKLAVVATPKPGRHVYIHRSKPAHNQKLACASDGTVLVETRGEGGYVLAPGCPPACHPSGGTYEYLDGPTIEALRLAPPLSDDDYELLIGAARSLDQRPPSMPEPRSTKALRAGDEFNRRASWREILEPHGWQIISEHSEGWTLWRRPGKDSGGGSATTGFCSTEHSGELMRVFTTNAPPFQAERAYSKFAAHTLLNHAGDFKASARALHGATAPRAARPATDVLVPGAHVLDGGEYVEVNVATFASSALSRLPPGTIYRRAGIPGELIGDPLAFQPLSPERARLVASRHVRFSRWTPGKEDEDPKEHFIPATRDHGAMLLSCAVDHPDIRILEHLVTYPVFDAGWRLTPPGHSSETYYDEPPALRGLRPVRDQAAIRRILLDLVVDFPFASDSDRTNFFGLILSPMIRSAIDGNCPLHLVCSPQERTGKSKLASDVIGGVYLGHPIPALQLTGSEDEREKRIFSLMFAGTRLVLIDNLADSASVDSPALASALTSAIYQGRILGRTGIVDAPNGAVIIATGNNPRATAEISKRTVPIKLESNLEHPEERRDFQHPDIAAYAVQQRKFVIEALAGMVMNWVAAGHPLSGVPMGGFDRWAAVVGGVLRLHGFTDWLENVSRWRESADDYSADLETLVVAWARRPHLTGSGDLMALAREVDVFPTVFARTSEKGQQTAFATGVLRRAVGRVVAGWRVTCTNSGNNRKYALERP